MRQIVRAVAILLLGAAVGAVVTRTFFPRERYPHLAAALDAGIDRRVKEIRVRERPLADVFDVLREQTGANIFVDWSELAKAGISADQTVTLALRDVRLETALDVLAEDLSDSQGERIFWTAADGVIRFSYPDAILRLVVVRTYDVRDLVGESQIAPASGGPISGGGPYDLREEVVEDLIGLIEELVEPDSWRDVGGTRGSIRAFDGRFVIHQTPEAHRQIEDLLRQLRAPAEGP